MAQRTPETHPEELAAVPRAPAMPTSKRPRLDQWIVGLVTLPPAN
jgi:hypothetical protein